jgi:hypothetical protein
VPPTVSFVVTSIGGYRQVAAQLALLHSARRPGSEIVLLAGADCSADAQALAGLEVRCAAFPGASIFDLRTHIPAICRTDWVCVVEDHATLGRGAVDALYGLIERRPEIDAIVVLAKNLTSASRWAWANFLYTFSCAWAPMAEMPRKLFATNVAVRRARLGTGARLGEGDWELRLIPAIYAQGNVAYSNEIFVDHIKHVGLRGAMAINFHNARACAALFGRSRKSMRGALREGLDAVLNQQRDVRAEIAHRKRELPTSMTWRLHVIGLAHFLGAVLGARFGAGDSVGRLD